MPAAAFCLIFGTFIALFGAMLVGASRNTHTVSAYAQTARSVGRRLVPIGVAVAALGVLFLGIVVARNV